jgi:hypothetical protein
LSASRPLPQQPADVRLTFCRQTPQTWPKDPLRQWLAKPAGFLPLVIFQIKWHYFGHFMWHHAVMMRSQLPSSLVQLPRPHSSLPVMR